MLESGPALQEKLISIFLLVHIVTISRFGNHSMVEAKRGNTDSLIFMNSSVLVAHWPRPIRVVSQVTLGGNCLM